MGIADALAQLEDTRSSGCRVCDTVRDVYSDDRNEGDAFVTALNGSVSADSLADILSKNGYPVSATSIRRHRRSRHQESTK